MGRINSTVINNALKIITRHTSTRNLLNEVDGEYFPEIVIPTLREYFKKDVCCSCRKPYVEEGRDITFVVVGNTVKWWHTVKGQKNRPIYYA